VDREPVGGQPSDALATRLVVVTGKGGVGKSTAAAAVGVAAARRGLRTVIVEVAGSSDVARMLGGEAGARLSEPELRPGLHHVTIDPRDALEEYLRGEVRGPFPAAILARSRAFELFLAATPGMRELLTIGKVWELAQRPRHKAGSPTYDRVVLDAPASGHVLALLAAPGTFGTVARVGPVAHQGAAIDAMLRDPRSTAVIVVATPEQMAVTETLELRLALRRELELELDCVIVNHSLSSRFSAAEAAALTSAPDDPAVRDARWLDARARAQRAQLARLRRGLKGVRSVRFPFLFSGEVDQGDIERFAGLLERSRS
jgi:anion-transporting  ArsA/GET3 family ATPase